MNILDENTKAMLDAGQVAVLSGGYLVLTPETLKRTVQSSIVDVLEDVVSEQPPEEEANDSSINHGCKCHFCGKESDFTEYIITISGGYDSDHDMERVSIDICSKCLERMLAAVS